MSGLTVHMLVKNEDQWLWFALQSVLPYADVIHVIDTGSQDKTREIIKSIESPKIRFEEVTVRSPLDLTNVRNRQLQQTKTPWMWLVDGDEIYTKRGAQEIVALSARKTKSIGVVRRFDLLGDIYHKQKESVGTYSLYGKKGHIVTRVIKQDTFPGLRYAGDYPNEGLFVGEKSLQEMDPSLVQCTENALYHAMYLQRSSLGSEIHTMFNRSKYKIETGVAVTGQYPEVFLSPRPSIVPNPLKKRSLLYESAARIVTPIKNLKRTLLPL